MKKLLTLTILTLIVGCSQPNTTSTPTTPTPNIPADWTTYQSPDGYTISFPNQYTTQPTGRTSTLILDETTQGPVGNTNFIYISFISPTETDPIFDIYNYTPSQFSQLLAAPAQYDISEGELPEYFTYTKQSDTTIANIPALTYTNDKPWEFPGGTSETRYLLTTDQGYYLMGAYYQPDSQLDKTTIDAIFQTLQLTPIIIPTIPQEQTQVTIPTNWITTTDPTLNITISHPSDWKTTLAPTTGYGGLLQLNGTHQGESFKIEIGRHQDLTYAPGQDLRDIERTRSHLTQFESERSITLNGRPLYQQTLPLRSGSGLNSPTHGIYNLLPINDQLYFLELYTSQPTLHYELISQLIASIN